MSRRPVLICGLALCAGLAATAWAQQDPPPVPRDPPPHAEEFAPPIDEDDSLAEEDGGDGQFEPQQPPRSKKGNRKGVVGGQKKQGKKGRGRPEPGEGQYPEAPGGMPGARAMGEMPGGMGGMPGGMGGMPGGMGGMPGRARIEDPEMAALQERDEQLEQETVEVADYIRRANSSDPRSDSEARAEMRERLTALVTEHFAVRQERRELEIKRIAAQLELLRGALKKRSDERDSLISRRVSQLAGEDELGF